MSDEMKTGQPPKAKTGRGMRIVLIVSLALNLLIAGLVVGAVLSGGPKGHRDMRMPPHVRALAFEDRRAIGRGIRAAYKEGRLQRDAGRAQARQLALLLEAAAFDRAEVTRLVDEMEAAKQSRFEVAREVWLDRVEAMSVQERAAYAARLREGLARKGKAPERE